MTEAESHASIVKDTGLTFDEVEKIGLYKMRLLLGYKEPAYQANDEVDQAEIMNEIKAFRLKTLGK